MHRYKRHLKPIARELRNNTTDAEHVLWKHLRDKQLYGIQFYRQKPLGPYIVDFYAASTKLVIEVDGSQHMDLVQHEQDVERDAYLNSLELKVLRFDNRQVLCEIDAVLEMIRQSAEANPS